MNLKYNDVADDLTKDGTSMTRISEEPLTLTYTRNVKNSINISWEQTPPHPWYLSQCPGALISFKGDKRDQTTFA
ncbi:hypothetical protein TNCT_402431 [Trichonephila clavata]|uniref:Uncharacterized protein n=1 Tax=Trichonephila clavata TaxID=2740835 RepID=A0A8X6FE20_TRICU|nr:hypothetical protein TNCT_402431 [Trichonephila clavata]